MPTLPARFIVKQGFGFKLVHLGYQNSITPHGKYLSRHEIRKFKGYFLGLPLFEKSIIANAVSPRFDDMGGGGAKP